MVVPSHHYRTLAASLLVAMLQLGCGPSAPPAQLRAPAPDTTHLGASVLADVPILEANESLRLGAAASTDPHSFSRIAGFAVAPNGDIAVLDKDNAEVVVFSAEGKLLRKFGRLGEGPGEFSTTIGAAIAIGADTLFVLEQVLHAFDLQGKLFYSRTVESLGEGEAGSGIYELVFTPHGLVVTRNESVRHIEDGEARHDTIMIKVRPTTGGHFARRGLALPGVESFRFGSTYTLKLFSSSPRTAVSRSGNVFYSYGDEYFIDVMAPDGTLRSQIMASAPRPAISRSESRAAFAEIARLLEASKNSNPNASFPDFDIGQIPRETHRAFLGQLLAGDGDTVLVERVDLGPLVPSINGESLFDIISLSGGFVARFRKPPGVTLKEYRAGKLYGIVTSELGLHELVRYEVRQ